MSMIEAQYAYIKLNLQLVRNDVLIKPMTMMHVKKSHLLLTVHANSYWAQTFFRVYNILIVENGKNKMKT